MSTEPTLPLWEQDLVERAIALAESRRTAEHRAETRARRRALQLAREQAYIRLALAIDRPRSKRVHPNQLSLFPATATLFDPEP
jgi:hypothetical protein